MTLIIVVTAINVIISFDGEVTVAFEKDCL